MIHHLLPLQFTHHREFRTNNLLDMAQHQCHKMFGHVLNEVYAFGSGVDKFPEWMRRQENGDKWRGIKRLVGNRSAIYLENAVIMFYMADHYRVYCRYVLKHLKRGNALHKRLLAKLESTEMLAGLKARALFFLVFHQPLRVTVKSTKFGGGKPPSQLHMHPVWNRIHDEMVRLETDPSFALDPTYCVFSGMSVVEEVISSYRTTRASAPMVSKVFQADPKIDDHVLILLKAYGTASRLRFTKSVGGCAEFLAGGKYHDLTADLKIKLAKIPATSDAIESFFGVLDMVSREQSKNISFHVQSGLATWRYNKTSEWLLSLTEFQRNFLAKDARREGRKDKRKTDECISNSDKTKLDRMEVEAHLERTKLKAKCRSLMDNLSVPVYRSRKEWDAAVADKDKMGNVVRRMIQLQVRLLVQRYGLKRSQLMSFSSKATGPFDNDVVVERYEDDVLEKIEGMKFKLTTRSLASQLRSETHVFRGGKSYDDDDTTYEDGIIKEVREERNAARWLSLVEKMMNKDSKKSRKKSNSNNKSGSRRKKLNGMRILQDGSRWNLSPDEYYVGVILKRATYICGKTGKSVNGYQVHWLLDDVKEFMSYEELVPRVKDYDEWGKENQRQLDDGDSEGENGDVVVNEVSVNVVEKEVDEVGCVGESVDDLMNDIQDHCRDLMMTGEGDQYHSDDDMFMIGGEGDQKYID